MNSILHILLVLFPFLFFSVDLRTPIPRESMSFMEEVSDSFLHLRAGFDNAYYLSDTDQTIAYYLEIKADEYTPPDQIRVPLNIAIVIDRSGSMSGEKLQYVKKAVNFVIDNLSSDDLLSITTYDTEVEVVVEPQKVTDKDKLKSKVNDIISQGVTNLSGGMLKGYELVKKNYRSDYVNRVLLLSDGLANRGITSEIQLNQIAKTKSLDEGIGISSFGVGLDFNEDLMMNLAEYGRGNYHFIELPDDIPGIFQKELKGLLSVVAQNLELKIKVSEGMRIKRLYGYEQGNNPILIDLSLHDLISEETKSMVIELEELEHAQAYTVNVELSYDDAITGNRKVKTLSSVLKRTDNRDLWNANIDTFVSSQHIMFRSNYLLSQTMKAIDEGNTKLARGYMDDNQLILRTNSGMLNVDESLYRQDSLVKLYDSTVLKPTESGVISKDQLKYEQKSIKQSNYSNRTKKMK